MATFGLFVSARPGDDPVGVARRAEALGFDLISVSDHLHRRSPAHETWTLLTWMAARTERVRVMPNVLGLPYRHPAVVAKMAESLDRLSSGRLVLGLGAGGNDAEFRAFGLAERSPAEKVEALEEAIDVARGLWAEPRFSHDGKHFRTREARIEPRPERPIPIWLGVYGDRMLDLVGRKADGWLPSLYFLPADRAAEKMERVRKAAADAGRDPDEITYAYNVWTIVQEGARPKEEGRQVAGGPQEVAETLAGFLRAGFTHLNISPAGETETQLERLANEVVPAVRDATG